MPRLPFNPSKLAAQARAAHPQAGPPAGPSSAPPDALTVSQVAQRIDLALRNGFPAPIRVVGEVSGFRDRTHWYFDLKDAEAVVNCVMFAPAIRATGAARTAPENGRQVVITARVEFYARGGRTTLIVERIEPIGAGALELAFRKLCEELRALGWFDPARKRPLPRFPRRIAVVTSRTGAALQDALDTMRRRAPWVDIALVDVRVQGDQAAPEIAAAVGWLGREHERLGVDAILVTRGGGSMEDLWAFNERAVAEAIVNCPVPVVAAIGHETDTTIAELVADERAATPTQAAMRLTPDRAALIQQTDSRQRRLEVALDRLLRFERQRLRSAARHPFFTDPRWRAARARAQLDEAARRLAMAAQSRLGRAQRTLARRVAELERHRPATVQARRAATVEQLAACLAAAQRSRIRGVDIHSRDRALARAMDHAIARRRQRLEGLAQTLAAVGPLQVLDRGYSLTSRPDGTLIRSAADIAPGQEVATRLRDGSFRSIVQGETGRPGEPPRPPPPPPSDRSRPQDSPGTPGSGGPRPRKPKRRKDPPPGMDLFGGTG